MKHTVLDISRPLSPFSGSQTSPFHASSTSTHWVSPERTDSSHNSLQLSCSPAGWIWAGARAVSFLSGRQISQLSVQFPLS